MNVLVKKLLCTQCINLFRFQDFRILKIGFMLCAQTVKLFWLRFSGQFKDLNLNNITTAMADIYWRHSTDRKQMAVKELNKSLNRLCYYSSNGKWFFHWVALSWDLDFKASTWPALIYRFFWTGEELGNIIVEYNSMFSHFFSHRSFVSLLPF